MQFYTYIIWQRCHQKDWGPSRFLIEPFCKFSSKNFGCQLLPAGRARSKMGVSARHICGIRSVLIKPDWCFSLVENMDKIGIWMVKGIHKARCFCQEARFYPKLVKACQLWLFEKSHYACPALLVKIDNLFFVKTCIFYPTVQRNIKSQDIKVFCCLPTIKRWDLSCRESILNLDVFWSYDRDVFPQTVSEGDLTKTDQKVAKGYPILQSWMIPASTTDWIRLTLGCLFAWTKICESSKQQHNSALLLHLTGNWSDQNGKKIFHLKRKTYCWDRTQKSLTKIFLTNYWLVLFMDPWSIELKIGPKSLKKLLKRLRILMYSRIWKDNRFCSHQKCNYINWGINSTPALLYNQRPNGGMHQWLPN